MSEARDKRNNRETRGVFLVENYKHHLYQKLEFEALQEYFDA
jgi:hypothetical protein